MGCGGYLGNRASECDKPHSRNREPLGEMISRMCRQVSQRLVAIVVLPLPIGLEMQPP